MNIDDRLRSAQRGQLDAVRDHVTANGLARPPARPQRPSPGRLVFLAAAVVVVAVAGGLVVPQITQNRQDRLEMVTSVDAATPSPEPAEQATTEQTTTIPTTVNSAEAESTVSTALTAEQTETTASSESAVTTSAEPGTTSGGDGTTSSAVSSPTSTAPNGTSSQSTTSASSSTSTPADDVALAQPVANLVCPSGYRAPLERAGTIYLSDETGWKKKDSLIDEQDGPHYYTEWEPNFEGFVAVEVVLPKPVMATDIRVAQNPFVEVGGTLNLEAAGNSFTLELQGMGGWVVHEFDEPTRLDRFTIERDNIKTNIVEVLICVDRP